jgi:Flp pilus assembly protein TadD
MNFEKGVAQYKEGNFEAALAIFHELIIKEASNPTFYLYRGRILTRLGKGARGLGRF